MSVLAKAREISSKILGDNDVISKSNVNTDVEWAALQKVKGWLDDDRAAKSEFENEAKEMHKAYMGDHWSLKGPTGKELRSAEVRAQKPNSVDNIIFSQVEGFVAEYANVPKLSTTPGEYSDEADTVALTELDEFVLDKNKFPIEQRKSIRNFFKYGPIIDQVFWDPTWQGGVGPNRWIGDIRIKSIHPDAIYIDARCKDNIDDARRIHKVIRYPLEHFKETFPEKGQYVQEDTSTYFKSVGDEDETTKSNNKTAWKVETWYKGFPLIGENKGYGLHVLTWSGDVLLKHQSYIYPEPMYPFIFDNLYDREGTIWGFGEIKQIISPQIVYNKEDEMILEGNMHQAFGQTLYAKEAIGQKQKRHIENYGSQPGRWFEVTNVDGVKRLYGNGVPGTLSGHMEAKLKAIENITGRFDTTQGRIPAGITAASAIIELNSRATNRMKTKEETLKTHWQKLGEKVNKFICWYYEEKRGYRILQPNNQYEFKQFSNKQIQKVHIFKDSSVVPLEQFNPMDMVGGEDYEIFTPEFDTHVKVDNEMPSNKAYYIELAKELYATKIIDQQAVLYVIENGRLEPMQEIMDRMLKAQQPPPPPPPGAMPPQGQPQGPPLPTEEEMANFVSQLPPELKEKLLSLPIEEQPNFLLQLMQGGGPDENGR